ncbi:MAG: hypothetical protein NVS4B7_12520 [Ktedonobacteraceae bacterium]
MSNLVIFDLDGVITSEECYWDAAGLTLHELCYSPRYWNIDVTQSEVNGKEYQPVQNVEEHRQISRSMLPEAEILVFKARAINSNWDTCYAGVCLCLIELLGQLADCTALLPLKPWDDEWLAAFREKWREVRKQDGEIGNVVDIEEAPSWLPINEWMARQVVEEGDSRQYWFPRESAQGFLTNPWPFLPLRETSLLPSSSSRQGLLFDRPVFQGYVGLGLINRFDMYASEVLECAVEGVFSRYSPFWTFCRNIFQEWFLGDELYSETYGHEPTQRGKPGCIKFERPLLPVEEMRSVLAQLCEQGYVLGFATGRTYQEAMHPLKMYGLLSYFDEAHISPYDYVERAEVELRKHGNSTLLGKPHPFQFLMAVDADRQRSMARLSLATPLYDWASLPVRVGSPFVVVGDSTSDILGGRAAGAITVAVLTGARTAEARQLLEQSRPDFTIEDMTKVPELLERLDSLATMQQLQFAEREKAEKLLQRWFARHMKLETRSVRLTPKAVSLNSFNGFYSLGDEEYFFKTHVEEQGVLEEYYAAELLDQAGYNVVRPLQVLHEEGRQMVVYPVVQWPVMFDLMRAVETGQEGVALEMLAVAEQRECERLLGIYERTLVFSAAEEHERAPIHQLFWHRLVGERYKRFYAGKVVPLPGHRRTGDGEGGIQFEELLRCRWTIYSNDGTGIKGSKLSLTLGELIERAKEVLDPRRESMTVLGHGDAHFGNIFLENKRDYLYFDPAFAGRHSPLLDVVKPFFHNVFATWMYFPAEVAKDLQLTVSVHGTDIIVEHSYKLSPVRQAILATKVEALLKPLKRMLSSKNALPTDWEDMLRLALMCCPLLTVNLLDERRMPAEISWLGLLQVMQMGHLAILGE